MEIEIVTNIKPPRVARKLLNPIFLNRKYETQLTTRQKITDPTLANINVINRIKTFKQTKTTKIEHLAISPRI